uniref:Triphosphoribosyl-dephospho-CoA synthase n=1 Tax=Macrostomum lignano TaxID=282301 RepID=A0A1I8HDD6_9PLAT
MHYWEILQLLTLLLLPTYRTAAASVENSGMICAAADSLSRLAELFARNSLKIDADGYFGAAVAFLTFDSAPASASATERRVADLKNPRSGGDYDFETYWGICRPLEAVMRRLLSQRRFRWRWLEDSGPHGAAVDAKQAQAWLKSVERLVMRYNDTMGDACFSRLLDSPSKRRMFLSAKPSMGYALTHQLIYLAAAIDRSCHLRLSTGRSVDQSLAAEACRSALAEHRKILALNSAGIDMIDLALEQAFICGSLGYRDFFTDSTLLHLRRLQDERLGCITEELNSLSTRQTLPAPTGRKLMHEVMLDGACSSHTSGLTAVYLSLFLRGS